MKDEVALAIVAVVISFATFIFNSIWQPFALARNEAFKRSVDLWQRYTNKHQDDLDVVQGWKAKHGSEYWRHWHAGCKAGADTSHKKQSVECYMACQRLKGLWREVAVWYEAGGLPNWLTGAHIWPFWGPQDFMTGRMMRYAIQFWHLVEPIDCANYYVQDNEGQYEVEPRPGMYEFIGKHASRKCNSAIAKDVQQKLPRNFPEIYAACRSLALSSSIPDPA